MSENIVSLNDYLEMVKEWNHTYNGISEEKEIFNVKNYYKLAHGFLIKKFTDICEQIVSSERSMSIMSFVCMISSDSIHKYNFIDNKYNMENINKIIWVDTNSELPELRIDNCTIFISFEMMTTFVIQHWNMIYTTMPELVNLQDICILNSSLMEITEFDDYIFDNNMELFYNTKAHFDMLSILNR